MPKTSLRAAYQQFSLFNANSPDALEMFRNARNAVLKKRKNTKTNSPYAKPLRHMLAEAQEQLSGRYATALRTMEEYGVAKPLDATTQQLMGELFSSIGSVYLSPVEHKFMGDSMMASSIGEMAQATYKDTFAQIINKVNSLDEVFNYFYDTLISIAKHVKDKLNANNPPIVPGLNNAYFLTFYLSSTLLLHEALSYKSPELWRACKDSFKKKFADEILPDVIDTLLAALNNDAHQASVIKMVMSKRTREHAASDIQPLAELMQKLEQIASAPLNEAVTFVEETRRAGLRF